MRSVAASSSWTHRQMLMRQALVDAGFPARQADGLIEDYAHYRRNEASMVTAGVVDATGREPPSFQDFARDYTTQFSQAIAAR